MRYKRILSIGLSIIMALSAAGCEAASDKGAEAGVTAQETSESGGSQTVEEETPDAEAAGEAVEGVQESASAEMTAETSAKDTVSGKEISLSDISVKWDDSRVYPTTSLGNWVTISTYEVKGYEDVPFVKASDYLNILFEGKEKINMESGVMKISVNGTTAAIDPASDTIEMEDPARLRDYDVISGAIVSPEEYNVITPSVKNQATETANGPLVVLLGDYHMPAIAYEEDILLPFLALQNTFGNICMNVSLAYNGKDYFNVSDASKYALEHMDTAKDTPYMKAIFSGPFSTKEETTQAYADYGYYSDCLLLDLAFGHKEEKNITTFDEYFTRMNAKKLMCSTNPSSAVISEFLLFNFLFDSGHDSLMSFDTVFGSTKVDKAVVGGIAEEIKGSEGGSEFFDSEEQTAEADEDSVNAIVGALLEKGFRIPEVVPLYIWSAFMEIVKPEDYGDQRLDYAGDTAVIYFSHFMDDTTVRTPSYYLDPIREEDEKTNNFAFFYNCFTDIQKHDEVKNVVINLSANGGGDSSGLISILGFLSEDGEVHFTDKDMLTGSYREEWYHVDTNLDGVADDQDGYGGQYNFYIMCSGSSYSCGNALPYFAQQDGLAKVIGTLPGGGDCVVGTFVDAYGRCAGFSSMLKIGKETDSGFVSDEKATVLDYDMMPSIVDAAVVPWFDAEGLAAAVHDYQSGASAAVYSEEEEGQAVSEFMEKLLERSQK